MIESVPFKKVLDGISKLNELKKELSEVEFKEILLALKSDLLDAQEDILRLRAENLELKSLLDEYKKSTEQERNSIEVQGFLYDLEGDKPVGLPYCPTCLVKEGKRYRLSRSNENYSRCKNCDKLHNAGLDGRVNVDNPPRPRRVTRSTWTL